MTVHLWLAEWSSWGWPLLANHLWQATLISFFACAAIVVLRKAPGRARYVVWMIASVRFVLPSALLVSIAQFLGIDSSLLASHDGSSEGATIIFQLTAPINQLDESVSAGAHGARDHSELFCALTIVWLAGSVVLLALWLKRRRRFRLAMRATSVTDTSRERQALERVRSWMQIKRDIRLSKLPGTIEPGVWGVWRPIVFLPECMAEALSEPELEAVMLHEMVHVARWDNLIANLHRLLCCVFWFHPMVWMLDRLLLTERERACDEEVIRLGAAPDVYASSLLKVLRFCLGWNIAGASNATGSNLGRRVEQIVSKNVQLRVSLWHRVALGSIAALVIVLSTAAGLLTREGVGAQTWRPPNRVIGGVPGGIPGGVPGGVPGAVPGGVPDGVPGEIPSGVPGELPGGDTGFAVVEGQERLIERLDQAPEINVEFKNSAKAPVGITAARVRAVPREIDGPGDEFAVVPVVTLTNNTERRIRGFTLEFRNGLERRAYYERAPYLVAPHGVYTSGGQKRFIILAGRPEGWSVRVGGVVFEDGEVWGVVPPPAPPPPPPVEYEQLDQAPEAAIRFTNREGSPLSITSATVKAARIAGPPRNASDPNSEERYLIKLAVHLVNNTARRISGVAIEYPTAESKDWMRTHASVKIEPHETYKLESPQPEAPGYGALFMRGSPDRMEARVIGVKFEDGEVWGSFPSSPPPPPVLTSGPEGRKLIRKSSGVLVESATLRVVAESPPLARAAKITGSVVVEVTIDEGGVVIASRAISGHPLLKDAAVNAASQWQFKPTTLSGVPVKVIGTLTFHFEP